MEIKPEGTRSHAGENSLWQSLQTCRKTNYVINGDILLHTYIPLNMTTLADRHQNQHDKYLQRVYSVEILLMMDSGPIRNMQITLSNKFEKQCTSLAFITRIYHDSRSSECQIPSVSKSLPSFDISGNMNPRPGAHPRSAEPSATPM